MINFTRRAALGGLATLGATGSAAPAATLKVVTSENDLSYAHQLAQVADTLSAMLADFYQGQFKTEVWPANHPRFPGRLMLYDCTGDNPATVAIEAHDRCYSAEERLKHHLLMAGNAMDEICADRGGHRWGVMLGGQVPFSERCIHAYRFHEAPDPENQSQTIDWLTDVLRWSA